MRILTVSTSKLKIIPNNISLFTRRTEDIADSHVMVLVHLKNVAFQLILYTLRAVPVNSDGRCIPGAFFFAIDRNMIEEHALGGHVIANVTAKEPIRCFKACRLDCRCISFNYQPRGSKSNCQLNKENRYTTLSALGFKAGWNYYDLAIEYGINVRRKTTNVYKFKQGYGVSRNTRLDAKTLLEVLFQLTNCVQYEQNNMRAAI